MNLMKTKEPAYRHRSVLLVDDNELDNFINHKTIEAHLFAETIYTATNGKSAIDFIRNLLLMDDARYPEVIFIDLNMPLMDGFQLIEYCKGEPAIAERKIKLVVLTSSLNEQDKSRVSAYMQDIKFLNKPLTEKMLEVIDK